MPRKNDDFAGDPGGLIGDAIFKAIKPIYKEGERAKRAASRPTRKVYYAPEPKVSQKEIVFEVLPQAIRNAGSNFSARDLFYAVRPLAYAHNEWESGKVLDYRYFSQGLLTEYQEQEGPIAGLWRDPRGHLHEPHTGASVGLGTREVAAYEFPEHTFDKILYVEKEGELSKLRAARLAERYDMAICSGKGQPTEAVRDLFARAEGGDYQLFVFHDADLDGYNIARVMAEATRRMPDHYVDVEDIGLTVEDALDMDLVSEPFYRQKDAPWEVRTRLSDVAREYLYQRTSRGVRGKRFELNAILPDTRRIEYIEEKLREKGVRGKVIPPENYLRDHTAKKYESTIDGEIERALAEILDTERIARIVRRVFRERYDIGESRKWIDDAFEKDIYLSWRKAVANELSGRSEGLRSEMRGVVKKVVDKLLEDS